MKKDAKSAIQAVASAANVKELPAAIDDHAAGERNHIVRHTLPFNPRNRVEQILCTLLAEAHMVAGAVAMSLHSGFLSTCHMCGRTRGERNASDCQACADVIAALDSIGRSSGASWSALEWIGKHLNGECQCGALDELAGEGDILDSDQDDTSPAAQLLRRLNAKTSTRH